MAGPRKRPALTTVFSSLGSSAMIGALLSIVMLLGTAPSVQAEDLSRFVGSYVGRAIVEHLESGQEKIRDIDIVVAPYGSEGLRIDWITVGLVDGRRDVPGVKRWSQTALFEPSEDRNFMVEVGESSLFEERGDMEVVKGDPVRWARIDDDTLHACSFVVLEDGRYELQIYRRTLTEEGIDIHFERVVDGTVVRRVSGSTVRAD
ncbi:MAG: hypothetical protein ACR2Q4_00570 [Geminicoccaceae bacterium]